MLSKKKLGYLLTTLKTEWSHAAIDFAHGEFIVIDSYLNLPEEQRPSIALMSQKKIWNLFISAAVVLRQYGLWNESNWTHLLHIEYKQLNLCINLLQELSSITQVNQSLFEVTCNAQSTHLIKILHILHINQITLPSSCIEGLLNWKDESSLDNLFSTLELLSTKQLLDTTHIQCLFNSPSIDFYITLSALQRHFCLDRDCCHAIFREMTWAQHLAIVLPYLVSYELITTKDDFMCRIAQCQHIPVLPMLVEFVRHQRLTRYNAILLLEMSQTRWNQFFQTTALLGYTLDTTGKLTASSVELLEVLLHYESYENLLWLMPFYISQNVGKELILCPEIKHHALVKLIYFLKTYALLDELPLTLLLDDRFSEKSCDAVYTVLSGAYSTGNLVSTTCASVFKILSNSNESTICLMAMLQQWQLDRFYRLDFIMQFETENECVNLFIVRKLWEQNILTYQAYLFLFSQSAYPYLTILEALCDNNLMTQERYVFFTSPWCIHLIHSVLFKINNSSTIHHSSILDACIKSNTPKSPRFFCSEQLFHSERLQWIKENLMTGCDMEPEEDADVTIHHNQPLRG